MSRWLSGVVIAIDLETFRWLPRSIPCAGSPPLSNSVSVSASADTGRDLSFFIQAIYEHFFTDVVFKF